jgi:excinuclease ABC subunit A
MNTIILKGIRQNNLKNIDIEVPLKKAIVITGPSGSGKTSLAFETIYAEGQRRYMQSLSTYARQFLEKFNAPLVDSIKNIPPPIAVEQTNPVRNSRATVGTTTEVYDYLRLLYEKIGVPHCEDCDVPLEVFSREIFFKKVKKKYSEKTLFIVLRKTTEKNVKEFWEFLLQNGYNRAFIDGEVVSIEEYLKQGAKLKEAILVLDRIKISDSISKEVETRLIESLKLAFLQNNQVAELWVQKNDKYVFSETVTSQPQCPKCSKIYGGGTVSFSFNSPIGACSNCKGFGNTLEIDEHLIIPNANLSLAQGAIEPFTKPSLNHWQKRLLQFCNEARIDADMPYKDLPPEHKEKVYEGEKKFKGVRGVFSFLQKDKYKMRIRVFLSRYQSPFLCPVCKGRRLKKEALRVKIQSMNIAEVCDLSFEESLKFIKKFFMLYKFKFQQS